jgi:2-methylisocitrate lyase-like PEP mutase family enzyme
VSALTQAGKGNVFLALHHRPPILVLPNAWDVASARIFALAGFPAIATTSAGVAMALGYVEPEGISRNEMLGVVRRIVDAVEQPVTADIEAAYAETPAGVAETVRALIATGAVGMNIEDSPGTNGRPLLDIPLQAERLRAAREAADGTGIPFVINVRTDVYLFSVGDPESRFQNAVRRSNAYREAGADSLFVPGVVDAGTIAALVREIGGPINVLANAGVPSVPELERLGVARVSVGSGPMRATMALTRRIARELKESGTYAAFTDDTIPYYEAMGLFRA